MGKSKNRIAPEPAGANSASVRNLPVPQPWSIEALRAAINAGTLQDRVERLKRAGILTPEGEIAPLYQNWDTKISRAASDGYGEIEGESTAKPRTQARKRVARSTVGAKRSPKKKG